MRSRAVIFAALLAAACSDSTSPRLPDDGELPHGDWEILLESIGPGGARSYAVMSADGSYFAPLAGIPGDAIRLAPSPDGHTIAWLREGDDLVNLWLMDRYGAERRPLVQGDLVVHDMAWSPDGTRLAVGLSTLDDANDIWIYEADGGGTQITFDLPNATLTDRSPTWSPDGTRIALVSNRSGTTRLWTMNADGTDLVQVLTSFEGSEQLPAWSPDGAFIAFRASGGEGNGIGIVRPNGADYRLFPFSGTVGSIAWTPDGLILFTGVVDLNYEVHTLHPVTGAITRLTRDPSHELRASVLRWTTPSPWRGLLVGPRYALGRPESPGLEVADVNADGAPDLLLLGPSHDEIRLLRGVGDGTFQPFGGLTAPGDQRAVAVADVSRDAVDDIIVLGADALHVWRGSSVGPGVATVHPFDGDGRGLAVSDFDGDGSTDIVAIHERPAGFALLVHSSRNFDGEIVAVVDHQTTFANAGRACAGDVTGDGWDDLVVVTGAAAAPVVLLRGRADITFAEATVATTAVTADVDAIPVCADFNGDRRSDLALLSPGSPGRLTILRSTGSGFGTPMTIAVQGTAVAAADIDRDGDSDLLVTGESGSQVMFFRNRGDGVFTSPLGVGVGGSPLRLVLADLDRDGWRDAVVADRDGSVGVILNRGR